MPIDIQFPFAYAETGDTKTVSGRDFYEQHATILTLETLDEIVATPTSANERVEIVSALRSAYSQSPYFDTPTNVSIQTGETDEIINVSVAFDGGTQFTIPVSERDTTVIDG